MTAFLLLAALMIGAALAFIALPLVKHARALPVQEAAQRRQRALDAALAEGVIDAKEHAAKRTALQAETTAAAPARTSRAVLASILLTAALLPGLSIALYRWVGAPEALNPANLVAQTPSDGDRAPELDKAIEMLVERLKQQPDDVEGWALLARAYQALGRTPDALDAFRRAHALAKDNAMLAVEYAQTMAMSSPERRIDGEARSLLEGALRLEPKNQRALWLLGISDFQAGQFDGAIARWNELLPLLDPQSDVARSVKTQIAEAEAKRDGKPSPALAAGTKTDSTAAVASNDSAGAAPASNGAPQDAPKLTVSVSLAPALEDKLDPEATLFVFARAVSGPPMPLAIHKLKAAQLPITVTLDDDMAMMPNMKLSSVEQVVVGARVSRSGNAMPQSGDLQALSPPLDVKRTELITLSIDQIVP